MPLPRRLTYRFRAKAKPDLTINQILAWCDEFKENTKRWPNRKDGTVGLPDTTWAALDGGLQKGARGLPRGSSLKKLLLVHRGVRHIHLLPPLTEKQILGWADAHRKRTGDWPFDKSGRITDAPEETWVGIERALRRGRRGLPGGITLAQFLEHHRGKRNHMHLPRLTHEQILAWADEHHVRTGRWPIQAGGPIRGAPKQTWASIDSALVIGWRGLPGGESLAGLLVKYRGVRNYARLPPLIPEKILVWADGFRKRTGRWPTGQSGPIPEAPGETWRAVETALIKGRRGLPGDDSLSNLLVRHRGWRNKQAAPALKVKQIRAWAIAFHKRTGSWPTRNSGAIQEAPGETWCAADLGLKRGQRGLPGGSSLSQLVRKCRPHKVW